MKRISRATRTPDAMCAQPLKKLTVAFCSVMLLAGLTLRATACPLCLAPSQTWAEMVAESDVLLLGELVSNDDGSENSKPFSLVKIISIPKGKQHLPDNEVLRIEEYIFADKGDLVLLKGSLQDAGAPQVTETFATKDLGRFPVDASKSEIQRVSATEVTDNPLPSSEKKTLQWDFYEKGTRQAFDYMTAAPPLDVDVGARLKYFLKFLEHSDSLVATDAWSEFANAEYKDIKAVSDLFSAKDFRTWIADPNAEPERRGLYGLMLGMCGTAEDAEFLRQQIGQPNRDEIRFGEEGLMGGLLVLSGEEGLQFLESARLNNPKASGFDCFPVIQALQFAWSYESELFEKERLRSAMRCLLKHEDVREVVIRDLARWEDWNAVQQMPAVYKDSKAGDLRTVEAIASFLIVCRQSATKENGEKPAAENVAAAKELLEVIRKAHQRMVRTAEEELE